MLYVTRYAANYLVQKQICFNIDYLSSFVDCFLNSDSSCFAKVLL